MKHPIPLFLSLLLLLIPRLVPGQESGGTSNFFTCGGNQFEIECISTSTPRWGVAIGTRIRGTDNADRIKIVCDGAVPYACAKARSFQVNPDRACPGATSVFIFARGGNDRIDASVDCPSVVSLTVNGGAGNDTIDLTNVCEYSTSCENQNVEIYGGGGNDKIKGSDGDNIIRGGLGNDDIFGGYGGDFIEGGSGDDKIFAGGGANTLYGEGGNDNLLASSFGPGGTNRMMGGNGDDCIQGFFGSILYGGLGNDDITGAGDVHGDEYEETDNDGHDRILVLSYRPLGEPCYLSSTQVHGGGGNDVISVHLRTCEGVPDDLHGGSGNDNLYIIDSGELCSLEDYRWNSDCPVEGLPPLPRECTLPQW